MVRCGVADSASRQKPLSVLIKNIRNSQFKPTAENRKQKQKTETENKEQENNRGNI